MVERHIPLPMRSRHMFGSGFALQYFLEREAVCRCTQGIMSLNSCKATLVYGGVRPPTRDLRGLYSLLSQGISIPSDYSLLVEYD
jgi:hypothetical protein